MDRKLLMTNVLIHGFAATHAATAATLSQTMVGDEVALTTLTVTMIIAIARLYGQPVEVSTAFAFLGTFAGFYLGTRGAIFCIKWIPFVGNAANAIATMATTETLGWVTYYIVSKGRTIQDVKKEEVEALIEESKEERSKHDKQWKEISQIIDSMNKSDKALYQSILKKMQKYDLEEHERDELEQELESLFNKYDKIRNNGNE